MTAKLSDQEYVDLATDVGLKLGAGKMAILCEDESGKISVLYFSSDKASCKPSVIDCAADLVAKFLSRLVK